MPDDIPMPAGGAENPGESMWAAAEKLATDHEAKLTSEGKPIPGGDLVQTTEPTDDTDTEPEAKPEKPTKPEAKAERQPQGGVAGLNATERKQLEDLAAKAGLKVESNRVEPAERVKMREEKRAARESLAKEQERFKAWATEEAGKLQGGAAKYAAFEKALDSGDMDAVAKAAGHADWKALLNEQTKRMASPEYRRIQEQDKRLAELEEREKRIEAQRTEREQSVRIDEQVRAYKVTMAEDMKGRGGLLEPMSADPEMVDFLYGVAADHYRATGDELDLEELLDTPSRRLGDKTPLDLLRQKWEALNAVFGDRPAMDEASPDVARRSGSSPRIRERKPPKTVSQRNAAEASAPPEFKDEAAYKRYFTNLLNQSTHTSG